MHSIKKTPERQPQKVYVSQQEDAKKVACRDVSFNGVEQLNVIQMLLPSYQVH